MVEAMAETIVNALPVAIAPHMHWFMALFSVPLLMILGTDAFYYALLPIIIGVVQPFGITPETVAATFLLSATMATPISPSVAAVYVGLGLADVSISEHIRYSLRLVWPASIAVLILSTLVGVMIIPGYFEPPVRVFRATVPEKESHEFRVQRATSVPCL